MPSRVTANDAPTSTPPLPRAGPLLLLALGLLGHLYAAHAIGGSATAYTHHVLGFVAILAVTGAPLALAGRRFWPTQWTRTLLAIGAVQALVGLIVALAPSRVTQ